MNDEIEIIATLDDATARRVLATVAQARLRGGATPLEPTADLGRALAEGLAVTPPEEPAPEGDVARLALRLLAEEDPSTREAIVALASAPPAQRFDPATTLAVTAAALLVLQTHVRFARNAAGKWTLTVEKKPTSDSLLKPLVQALLSRFPVK
jgi:hypothetical protein